MPLGSAGAPPRLQRLTQNVFIYELDDYVIVYLDDASICLKTNEEHVSLLRLVLLVAEHQLHAGINKCDLEIQKGRYVGYVVQPERMSPDRSDAKALEKSPEKRDKTKQVRGFLGLVRYFRRLTKGYNLVRQLSFCAEARNRAGMGSEAFPHRART